MWEIQTHYGETSKVAQRKHVDRDGLKKIFYKNETNLTLDKYVTKLKEIFNVLGKFGVPTYEEQIV